MTGSVCIHLLVAQWPTGEGFVRTDGDSAPIKLNARITSPLIAPLEKSPFPVFTGSAEASSEAASSGWVDDTTKVNAGTPPFTITSDIYHLREELSRPPQLEQDVDLSPLARVIPVQALTLEVELFINEAGLIDRVEITRGKLEGNARIGLMARLARLKFSSGEIDGRIVKSRIKIEVNFTPEIPSADGSGSQETDKTTADGSSTVK